MTQSLLWCCDLHSSQSLLWCCDLHSSPYLLSSKALAIWRLLDLSCRAIPWQHPCLKSSCLLGCRLVHLQVLLDTLSPWPEMSPLLLLFCFGALRLLPKCLRLALLLTSFLHLCLPIFLKLSAVLGCRTNSMSFITGVPRNARTTPVQDDSSWILSHRVPPSSATFSCFPADSHKFLPFPPLFG